MSGGDPDIVSLSSQVFVVIHANVLQTFSSIKESPLTHYWYDGCRPELILGAQWTAHDAAAIVNFLYEVENYLWL